MDLTRIPTPPNRNLTAELVALRPAPAPRVQSANGWALPANGAFASAMLGEKDRAAGRGGGMRAPTCEETIDVPGAAPLAAAVWAPEGVADEPGTPFGVTYEPAPVVLAGVSGQDAGELVPALLDSGHSVVTVGGEVPGAAGALEAMSRLGVTQAHLAGPLAGTIAQKVPARALSAAPLPERATANATAELLAHIRAHEPRRRHNPLVSVDAAEAHVAPGPEDIVVRRAVAADEPAIQAMYGHLLDACDVPGRETCGWRRGFWPLPDDVSRRLREGTTWVALERGGERPGAPVLGAMSLDGDFGLPGVEADWEPLAPGEMLTCHLLATDPAARGRGVATALLAAYAREGITRGCRALRINTSPQSLSNRLYRELGFTLHRPVWFPYEGLDLTGWTNLYEIRLDVAVPAPGHAR